MVIVPETSLRGAGPDAPAHGGLGGGLANSRMVGEPEIVVGAEQQYRFAVQDDVGPLGSADETGATVQSQ